MKLGMPIGLLMALIALSLSVRLAAAQAPITLGGGFNLPQGVAVNRSGDVFVSDAGNNQVKMIPASTGFTTTQAIGTTMGVPMDIAVDRQENLFVVNEFTGTVREVLAAGGYTTVRTLASGFITLKGIAVDAAGNVFVADAGSNGKDGGVYEIPIANNYATFQKLATGLTATISVAVDTNENLFVSDATGAFEVLAVNGNIPAEPNLLKFGGTTLLPGVLTIDRSGNVFVVDLHSSTILEFTTASGYSASTKVAFVSDATQIAVDRVDDVFVVANVGGVEEFTPSGGPQNFVSLGPQLTNSHGVSIDANDNLVVADTELTAIFEFSATSSYTDSVTLCTGFNMPLGIAVDGMGNVFVTDTATRSITEIPAAGGYTSATVLQPNGFGHQPLGALAVDAQGNIFFVVLGVGIFELPVASGYTTAQQLVGGLSVVRAIAVDSADNLFIPDPTGESAVREYLAADNYTTFVGLGSPINLGTIDLTLDSNSNVFAGGGGVIEEILAAGNYETVKTLFNVNTTSVTGVAVDGNCNLFFSAVGNLNFGNPTFSVVQEIPLGTAPIASAVLPSSRAVEVGNVATAFATMINTTAQPLDDCRILLPGSASTLTLTYQTTNSLTNAPTGAPNTPVIIPAGKSQSFVFSILGKTSIVAPAMPLVFACDGVPPAATIVGVDTLDLIEAAGPTPDVIALAATDANNGIVVAPVGGAAAFAVSSVNLGDGEPVVVSVNTGATALPLKLTICQTDPANGQCLAPPAASAALNFSELQTPTFSIFVQPFNEIPFAPANSRIFVDFKFATDTGTNLVGSTSVAVETM
ncbi:MAG: NHL repeat-containing protein [Aliidongia sp.]